MRPVNSIDELLEHMVARDASDLHVTVGTPPVIRVRGEVERLDEYAPLTPDDTQELLYRILSSEQQKNFEIKRQLDFSHSIPGLARFRVNVYFQRESIGAAFRLIPAEIKTLELAQDTKRSWKFFRDAGRNVLLMMDSITRVAMAWRGRWRRYH